MDAFSILTGLTPVIIIAGAVVLVGLECRRVRRVTDERIDTFLALSPEEQRRWIHPGSPRKPPGWTVEEYQKNRERMQH